MAKKKLKTISLGTVPVLAYANSVEDIMVQYAKQCFREKRISRKKHKKYVDKRDWKSCNAQLIKRGEYYINPIFLETWLEETKDINLNKVGQPYLYLSCARGSNEGSLKKARRLSSHQLQPNKKK